MKGLLLSITGLLSCIISVSAQTKPWKVVTTVPSGGFLTAVESPAGSEFVAVGDLGRILRSTDAGATWTAIPTVLLPEFSSRLVDLSFGTSLTGTAVGGSGLVMQTMNGGTEWVRRDVGGQGYLSSVSFLDANFGVITGSSILKTRDGGLTWESQGIDQEASIQDVVVLDSLTWFAVGPAGFAGSGSIFRTTDGGANWEFVHVPDVAFQQFRQIAFADGTHGLIVGSGGTVLRTEDGGSTWSLVASGVTAELYGVAMSDPMNAIAVGTEGTIISTTDGGRTWVEETSPTGEVLRGIAIDQSGTAVAVGGDGSGIVLRRGPMPSEVHDPVPWDERSFVTITPNPVSREMRVQWYVRYPAGHPTDDGTITIHNLLGEEAGRFVVPISKGQTVLSADRLSTGLYLVTLSAGGWRETDKIIVSR